jgi:hypothetical protein
MGRRGLWRFEQHHETGAGCRFTKRTSSLWHRAKEASGKHFFVEQRLIEPWMIEGYFIQIWAADMRVVMT